MTLYCQQEFDSVSSYIIGHFYEENSHIILKTSKWGRKNQKRILSKFFHLFFNQIDKPYDSHELVEEM